MKSPKISTPKTSSGFTLIEILVVVAIFTVLIGLGLFVSMDAYRAYNFRQEKDSAISLLRQARGRAMANINQTSHSATVSGVTVTFEQLSGNATVVPPGDIVLTGEGKTIKIQINSEGRINWENV